MYSTQSFSEKSLIDLIAFIHAFSGCDTTSAFFRQGKLKLISTLLKDEDLTQDAMIFNSSNADSVQIIKTGFKIIASLYCGSEWKSVSLNTLRYLCFKKFSKQKTFNLAMLYHQMNEQQPSII